MGNNKDNLEKMDVGPNDTHLGFQKLDDVENAKLHEVSNCLKLLFVGDDGKSVDLMESFSKRVLIKRILLVADNIFAASLSILFYLWLRHYAAGEGAYESIKASCDFIAVNPFKTLGAFFVLLLLLWRPIKHTKVFPFTCYVNDFVLLMLFLSVVLVTFFFFCFLTQSMDLETFPYWVSVLRWSLICFLFSYRRFYLVYASKINSIRSVLLVMRGDQPSINCTGNVYGTGIKDAIITIFRDLNACIVGPGVENVSHQGITLRKVVRRLFVLIDNMIAPALYFYFFVWIKLKYYGGDTSFESVVSDIFHGLDFFYVVLYYLLLVVLFWRFLGYSDALPCWNNFRMGYIYWGMLITSSFIIAVIWLNYLKFSDGGQLEETMGARGIFRFEDYVPFWIDFIRAVCLVVILFVRRFCLLSIDLKSVS